MISDTAGTLKTNKNTTTVRAGRELLLTLGAVLGTICLVLTITSIVFGIKPLIFRSGSMAPTIETGALAFSKTVPAMNLNVGDVVSVIANSGVRVTHRITKIDTQGTNSVLTLKGDANSIEDAETYVVVSADKILFSTAKAGYLIAWLSGPIGTFTAGLFVALVLLLAFRRRPKDNNPPSSTEPES